MIERIRAFFRPSIWRELARERGETIDRLERELAKEREITNRMAELEGELAEARNIQAAQDPAALHKIYHPLMTRVANLLPRVEELYRGILERPTAVPCQYSNKAAAHELDVCERRIVQLENELSDHMHRADRAEANLRNMQATEIGLIDDAEAQASEIRSLRSKLAHAKRLIGALESCAPTPAKRRK